MTYLQVHAADAPLVTGTGYDMDDLPAGVELYEYYVCYRGYDSRDNHVDAWYTSVSPICVRVDADGRYRFSTTGTCRHYEREVGAAYNPGCIVYGGGMLDDGPFCITEWLVTSHDMYLDDGTLFFAGASPLTLALQTARRQTVTLTLTEVVGLLGLLMPLLACLIGLRRGLAFVSRLLRSA